MARDDGPRRDRRANAAPGRACRARTSTTARHTPAAHWKNARCRCRDIVLDPCCGSGTTPVAAKLAGRNFIGIGTSHDARVLSSSRLVSPVKAESVLLETGREAYLNADYQVLEISAGRDYVPEHRNNGIDAIVNLRDNDSIALVRIQRKNETLPEACESIRKRLVARMLGC